MSDDLAARPRMADVARAAGVSLPTVSRALSGHPDVSDRTRERVSASAEALGYWPSASARALRTGRHGAISIVLPFVASGWWEPVLRGAGAEAFQRGFQMSLDLVGPTSAEAGSVPTRTIIDLLDRAASWAVDGCVILTPGSVEWGHHPALKAFPVVVIDDDRPHPDFHVWRTDSHGGAMRAVQHLIDQGRRNIIAVSPHLPAGAASGGANDAGAGYSEDRLRGYRDAMASAGLAPHVAITEETFPSSCETSDVIDRVLRDGTPFDAVFVVNDWCAHSILRSLSRSGISVPTDVSVMGFDGDLSGDATNPRLTTMAQPLEALGAGAVGTLVELIEDRAAPPVLHELSPTLLIKGTA